MSNGNLFGGFVAGNQARTNALGGAVNALAQGWQNKRDEQAVEARQQRALGYLVKASELSGQDDAASEQMFMQAYQEDPEFTTQLLQAQKARRQAKGEQYASASQREFESMIADLSPAEQERARRIRLGLEPRAVGSSAMTIAETGATETVAGSEAAIAGAKSEASEAGKGRGMAKTSDIVGKAKSDIAKAVKQAEIEGKALGEAQVSYNQAEAALPVLENVVGQLRELAPVATSTLGGRAFDAASKELGFGATDGATARAKFIAIVNNQVLPLLKQTFGAAFTVSEAESLKATMGDPNASPAEKMAQLDAFIEAKYRDLEAKSKEAGAQPTLSESALKYLEGN